jgi:3-oxoacyl-[acyl-carrier-protein] synthase-1
MINNGFLAGCANIYNPDPATEGLTLLTHSIARQVNTVMSNSFGFGGTNASLIFRRIPH